MHRPALEGYLGEICQHCWLALLASMQLRDLLDLATRHGGELGRPDANRAWRLQCWQCVQTILSSGSALSRMLWPPGAGARAQARGAALRSALGVGRYSPLRQPGIRHHSEGFDDALDRWLAAQADACLSFDLEMATDGGLANPGAARWLDPVTWTVGLLGTPFDLHGIVEEASRLQALASDPASLRIPAGERADC
jgi:hypothetical protein